MSTELTKSAGLPAAQRQQPVTLQYLVKSSSYTERFKEVLGERAPQFMASLLSVGKTMSDVEPQSIIASAMTAAVLNLPIEKNFGFAWLVPYRDGDKKYCQFQMGHKGLIQLALRTSQYSRMNARVITRKAFLGYDAMGEAKIDFNQIEDGQEAVGYWFGFQLVNGFAKSCYWPLDRVKEHAKRYSQSFKSGRNSPWQTHFDEMALKTVIKNELSDWGILSVELQKALVADQAIQRTPEDDPEYMDLPKVEISPASRTGAGNEGVAVPALPASGGSTKPADTRRATATSAPPPVPSNNEKDSSPTPSAVADPSAAQVTDVLELEPVPAPATPQSDLASFLANNSFSLDHLKRYFDLSGFAESFHFQTAAIASTNDISAEVSRRCLSARVGLSRSLKKIRETGAL